MGSRLLVVEDEAGLALALADRLTSDGYHVAVESSGDAALRRALGESFDLVVLDVMLPGISGYHVCSELRRRSVRTPILMLTAKDQLPDKVIGFKSGADDYLTKPFEVIELLVRIEALLRRAGAQHGLWSLPAIGLSIDRRKMQVYRDGQPLSLSTLEFKLLDYLASNRGRVIGRDELLQHVWGYGDGSYTRTVDVHMARLRRKLREIPGRPRLISTHARFGYRFAG